MSVHSRIKDFETQARGKPAPSPWARAPIISEPIPEICPALPPRPAVVPSTSEVWSSEAAPSLSLSQSTVLLSGQKRRPPVPPKSSSASGVLRSTRVAREPQRITLVDLEADESALPGFADHELVSSSESGNGTSSGTPIYPSAEDDAKRRKALLSNSVLNDVRELADTTTGSFLRVTGPLRGTINESFLKVRTDTAKVIDKSGTERAFRRAVEGAQTSLDGARLGAVSLLEKTGIPQAFALTKDDFSDVACRLAGKAALCSKCRSLPVGACFPDAQEVTAEELQWATPLSRIIYHAEWCSMCSLLISMLCRKEFDPLRDQELSNHVQPELRGLSMSKWIAEGWEFTDRHWPFGYGEKRHEGATHVLGPLGNAFAWRGEKVAVHAGRVALRTMVASTQSRKPRPYRPSDARSYRDGLREGRMERVRYPLSCVLQISIRSHRSQEAPGLLYANLIGYVNRPGAEPRSLSRFRLRVVQPDIRPVLRSTAPLSYGRLLDRDWIDLTVAKSWIEVCESRHGAKCNEHGWEEALQKPTYLRLLDTEDLCIVEAPDPARCRYITLSYVWGEADTVKLRYSNIASVTQRSGLEQYLHKLPRTITDAMEVVRQLGERYLWVDALCILQENTKEALEQIANMDRVYGNALMTIVAAHGRDANAGLPGVRRHHFTLDGQAGGATRQVSQASVRMDSGVEIIAPFPSRQDIPSTAWNTRAWTFQEKLLSRRMMIFSGGEVVWHCRNMICREDMIVEDSAYAHPTLDWLSLKPEYLGIGIDQHWIDGSIETTRHNLTHLVRSGTFNEYAKMVQQYTAWTMSFSSDMLNALTGLLHIFELCFRSEFTYGLPKSLLDTAILWRPTKQLRRRVSSADEMIFPSWSWAGWVGRVAYEKPFSVQRDDAGHITAVSRERNGEEGIRPLLRWHTFAKRGPWLAPLNGTGRGIPRDPREWPREWESGPDVAGGHAVLDVKSTPTLSQINPAARAQLAEHHLVFWTSCTSTFQLADAVVEASDRAWDIAGSDRSLRYSIVDSNFDPVGTLLLDSSGPELLDPSRHELILLAETQYFGLDDDRFDGRDYAYYLVMLVERDPISMIVFRLGLGKISKEAWKLAAPQIKLVCLG